jgi:hypothetical protein
VFGGREKRADVREVDDGGPHRNVDVPPWGQINDECGQLHVRHVTPESAQPIPRLGRQSVSLLVLGCGLLILVSLSMPFFDVPFGGDRYFQWLSSLAVVLGVIARVRRERGPLAPAAAFVSVGAAGLLILTVFVPLAYGAAMQLFMPD